MRVFSMSEAGAEIRHLLTLNTPPTRNSHAAAHD
jgi:hypothetical protein